MKNTGTWGTLSPASVAYHIL